MALLPKMPSRRSNQPIEPAMLFDPKAPPKPGRHRRVPLDWEPRNVIEWMFRDFLIGNY